MDKYESKSVEELTKILNMLIQKNQDPGLSTELRSFLCILKAHKLRHGGDAHAFSNGGGVEVLIALLEKCQEENGKYNRDLVLVLGTIGNLCALSKKPRSIVMKHALEKIVSYLQLSTDSDMVSTAARVLANLALDKWHIIELHKHQVVTKLSKVLAQADGLDGNCKKNAVRAIRLLCSAPECLEEIKQNDGIQLLVSYLKSEQVELGINAIQALEVSSVDMDAIQCLCNKDTMQSIIRYANHSKSKVRNSAMNILLSCVKTSEGRIGLSSAGGMETLVAYMESSDRDSSMFTEVVCAACTCCRDVISRQRLRDCGGLERLISMMADQSYASLHANIMSALVCYYFDENTLKLMVTKMGLVPTLNHHLREMTAKSRERAYNAPSSSLECAMDVAGTTSESVTSDDDQVSLTSTPPSKRPRLIDQSSSSSEPTSFLDSLLSSPSPYKMECGGSAHVLDSSPLAAGDMDSAFESQVILMMSRVSHLRECLVMLSYHDTLLTLLNFFSSTKPPNIHIYKILTRVLMNLHCFQNCITSLVPSKISKMLLEFGSDAPPSSSPLLSPPLVSVNTKFFGMCQVMMSLLSKNAESPCGQGVLAHLLLTGSPKEKRASSLSMPLLCRSPRVCKKFMMDYGAFQTLCDLLKDEGSIELQEMAMDSLLALSHNMGQISSAKKNLPRKYPKLSSSFNDLALTEREVFVHPDSVSEEECLSSTGGNCRYIDTDHYPFDLTMMLHTPSGQLVKFPAHKLTLIEESDVFRVMLGGNYMESSRSEVHIHSISPSGFLSMIHYIYGCGWQCKTLLGEVLKIEKESEEVPVSYSNSISEATNVFLKEIIKGCRNSDEAVGAHHCLQTLVCAGRFLFPQLITLCEHAAVKYIQPANMVAMFHFSQLHQCFCLAESCIRALVSLPHSQLRTNTFRDLITSTEGEAALQILTLFLVVP